MSPVRVYVSEAHGFTCRHILRRTKYSRRLVVHCTQSSHRFCLRMTRRYVRVCCWYRCHVVRVDPCLSAFIFANALCLFCWSKAIVFAFCNFTFSRSQLQERVITLLEECVRLWTLLVHVHVLVAVLVTPHGACQFPPHQPFRVPFASSHP